MQTALKYVALIFCSFVTVNALVDVSVDHALLNPGFHKLLKTNITIYGNLSSCRLLVEEKFPRNLFINAEEIENDEFEILTKLNQVLDVEDTASLANPFSVYVYLNYSRPITTSTEYHTQYLYYLPVHVRYHEPKVGGGYREFKKSPPALFASCPAGTTLPSSTVAKFPCDPYTTSEICDWTSLSYSQKHLSTQFLVPVGNVDHVLYVNISAYVTAILGMLYIIKNLHVKANA